MSAARWALAVALTWLTPWLAHGDQAPPRADWYDRAWPLAVAAALLRPGRAVRDARRQDKVAGYLLDAIIAMREVKPGPSSAPKARRLQLVGQPGSDAPPYSGRHLKGVPRTRRSAA